MLRWIIRICVGLGVIGVAVVAVPYFLLRASLPPLDGKYGMEGLEAPVVVEFDQRGIPRVRAETREDAYQSLGFVTARDRLFQMDLLRRSTAGRLAEIIGPSLVDSDRWHRIMGLSHLASEIYARLPTAQREALEAYSAGVNRAIDEFNILPFEFLILGYSPELWRPEDSLLVVLNMAVVMNWNGYVEDKERAATLMRASLPPEISAFLMPHSDDFIQRLAGIGFDQPLPTEKLKRSMQCSGQPSGLVSDPPPPRGSNGWVVGPAKTRAGHAILANDMHLDLGVPNLWYRAELHYGDVRLYGLFLPGVPALITGSNGHLAWGYTGAGADVADLVLLEVDPDRPQFNSVLWGWGYPGAGADVADLVLLEVDPDRPQFYRMPDGWHPFGQRIETIKVRGQTATRFLVRTTQWGPVLGKPLLGKPVAVRWTALDPKAVNLNHLDFDRIFSVEEAIPLFSNAGAPTLNVLLADSQGNIGWTLTGRLPRRYGSDGLAACVWADGRCGWDGYRTTEETPRLFNPSSGMLVNANQPMNAADRALAYESAPAYRAFRISKQLGEVNGVDEGDMLSLQLDTQTGFYRYYRDLAMDTLKNIPTKAHPEREALLRYIQSWDGRAELSSSGLPLMVEFRRRLLERVLSPIVSSCGRLDSTFDYRWDLADKPLQQILESRPAELWPDPTRYLSWQDFLVSMLEESAQHVLKKQGFNAIEALSWGRSTGVEQIVHPLSSAVPFLARWLDMPAIALPGCTNCVRMAGGGSGATERLVVSPGEEDRAILHMPGGQSGHPLSPHYRDQHSAWVHGRATPLKVGKLRHRLELLPIVKLAHGR